ncbi:hypothetical protein AgCh_027941 [Apium graveolens]
MEITNKQTSDYDALKEIKEFDDTKAGVKWLVDSGVSKIPNFFIHPQDKLPKTDVQLDLPVVSLEGFEDANRRAEIVAEIREACENWGFFRITKHGIPDAVTDGVLERGRQFHEQPKELKMEFYTRDLKRKVKYYSTLDLFVTKIGQWRDTVNCDFDNGIVNCDGVPSILSKAMGEYVEYLFKLKKVLSELLSEALGLSSDHLSYLRCLETQKIGCHYYPPCPQPELTLGTSKHSDPNFLTILLQDNIGALQILHENKWMDVPPMKESLLVNVGDLLQLITNDKFKSVRHRVVANHEGPRVSIASFFYPSNDELTKPYGPIKELVSVDNQAKYKEISTLEYIKYYMSRGLDGAAYLPHFEHPVP